MINAVAYMDMEHQWQYVHIPVLELLFICVMAFPFELLEPFQRKGIHGAALSCLPFISVSEQLCQWYLRLCWASRYYANFFSTSILSPPTTGHAGLKQTHCQLITYKEAFCFFNLI